MSQMTLDNGIVVNVFDGVPGASFPYVIDDVHYTNGRLDPGDYSGQFGNATSLETLWITSGTGTIGGKSFKKGDVMMIQKGEPISIVVDPDTVLNYICAYGVLGALAQTHKEWLWVNTTNCQRRHEINRGIEKVEGRWVLTGTTDQISVDEIESVELI